MIYHGNDFFKKRVGLAEEIFALQNGKEISLSFSEVKETKIKTENYTILIGRLKEVYYMGVAIKTKDFIFKAFPNKDELVTYITSRWNSINGSTEGLTELLMSIVKLEENNLL